MLKVSIVGAGGIASMHATCLSRMDDVSIAGVYDVVQQRAEELAGRYGAVAYYADDLQKCIDAADIVYILTPPSFHKDIALQCLRSNKAVFIEKPIAIERSDAEQIVEAAYKYSVNQVMLGFNMRYRKGYQKLKELIQTSVVGTPLTYWSQRFSYLGGGNWRTNPQYLSGFTIESLSHDIDLIQWLSQSEIVSVYGSVHNSRADLDGYDDNANVIFRLKDGTSASIQASWSSHLSFNNRGIIGTDGTAMVSGSGTWDIDTLMCRNKEWKEERKQQVDDPLDERSYDAINRYYIDCVLHDRKPEITAEYGLKVLQISHAILASGKTGKPVEL